jgi:hypothetical protein
MKSNSKVSSLRNEGQESERYREGPLARAIEKQSAKLPSDTFLWLAVGSIAAAAFLKLRGRNDTSIFVGEWAPTFLMLGLYNKLVKLEGGSDHTEKRSDASAA